MDSDYAIYEDVEVIGLLFLVKRLIFMKTGLYYGREAIPIRRANENKINVKESFTTGVTVS